MAAEHHPPRLTDRVEDCFQLGPAALTGHRPGEFQVGVQGVGVVVAEDAPPIMQ